MKISAFAAKSAKAKLVPFGYGAEPGPDDVVIKITHCGICHSDVHLADGDWGDVFPLVPGHEIVGIAENGPLQGKRVGVGWQCGSCGTCAHCEAHEEVLCAENQATCMGHHGGFSEKVIVNKRFAFEIPKELSSEEAAPLLCGGATVYTPLQRYAKKGMNVGVIGIGGLGHLAIQFASKMGCHVTAFSRTKEKEAEAKGFGAESFRTTPAPGSLDLILNTAHAAMEMHAYLQALKPKGVFVQLGAAPDPLTMSAMDLIGGSKTVTGSSIAHPDIIRELLAFAAKHGVKAKVEVQPMSQCNEAMEKTRKNQARYRMVLKN